MLDDALPMPLSDEVSKGRFEIAVHFARHLSTFSTHCDKVRAPALTWPANVQSTSIREIA